MNGLTVTVPVDVIIPLPQWGTVIDYPTYTGIPATECGTGATNCRGVHYAYTDVQINENFQVPVVTPWGIKTATKANVEAYFDAIYAGWQKVDAMDFSTNCHGYTFGKPHWVEPSPFGVLRVIGSNPNPCFVQPGDPSQATHAVYQGLAHSAKVKGQMCPFQQGPNQGMMSKIIERTEKNGPSPVYKKVIACGSPGDLMASQPTPGPWTFLKANPN